MKKNIGRAIIWFSTTVVIIFGLFIIKDIDVLLGFLFPLILEILTLMSEA